MSELELECIVPNFYEVAGSSIEMTALEMSFNANRVATLTEELNSARDEQINYLTSQRECYLRKLKHNIEEFDAERRLP